MKQKMTKSKQYENLTFKLAEGFCKNLPNLNKSNVKYGPKNTGVIKIVEEIT